ncbi:MAG: 4Fe-4S binding protein [Symbiobacteriaceae bacterium]|nr:4Fe-4S binding protein [Symbiobacteriaceae bacterium]
MATRSGKVSINNWCKSCGLCAAYCPVKALSWKREERPLVDDSKCVACQLCVRICPDFAISVAANLHREVS